MKTKWDGCEGLLQDCCEEVERLEGPALLTYLHSTISSKEHAVAVPDPPCYLDTYLSDMDLERLRVRGSLLRWPKLGPHWLRCVGVKAYPHETQPGMLDALASLPMEYRSVTRYLPLERAESRQRNVEISQGALRTAQDAGGQGHRDGHRRGGRAAQSQAALDWEREANQAQADVEHGVVNYGYFTQTVVVWDTTFEGATAKAEQVEQVLNNADFVAKVETVNTMDAWVGTLPGNMYANVRRPLLHSHNLAHLMPATAPWGGPTWNAHLDGPPLLRTIGRGHTPFNFDTYDGDVGMAYIAGPIGSGKSTLLATMVMQWLKRPGAEVKIIDTGQSLRCATYAMGGEWYDVARGTPGAGRDARCVSMIRASNPGARPGCPGRPAGSALRWKTC